MDIGKMFYVAMKSLLFCDGKFLIVRKIHRETGKPLFWELPGGRMEYGEVPEDTLKREVTEEVGLKIKLIQPLSVCNLWIDYDFQLVGVIYLCSSESLHVRLSDEHDDFRWITTDEIKNYDIHTAFLEEFKRWNWKEIHMKLDKAQHEKP